MMQAEAKLTSAQLEIMNLFWDHGELGVAQVRECFTVTHGRNHDSYMRFHIPQHSQKRFDVINVNSLISVLGINNDANEKIGSVIFDQ